VCEQLDISVIATAVGVSFGGLQAVHVAEDQELGVPRLVLHSCAPSGLPYPDTRAEAIVGPVLFSPLLQGLAWRLVRRVVRSDPGLRTMMARLSKLPVEDWWEQLSAADRDEARACSDACAPIPGSSTTSARGKPDGPRREATPCRRSSARRS
jgi:pimeloyl-ACP methyl ester carboxylesterase